MTTLSCSANTRGSDVAAQVLAQCPAPHLAQTFLRDAVFAILGFTLDQGLIGVVATSQDADADADGAGIVSLLTAVDFFDAEGRPIDGLVSVRRPAEAKSPDEHAVVRQAQAFEVIDFVFFRRFQDPEGRHVRSSQILAYVVDNTRQKHSKDDLAKLHHKLWLQGLSPLIYVAWPASVDVLSCARKPDFWDDRKAEVRYAAAETVDFSEAVGVEAEQPKCSALTIAADISDALSKRKRLSANRLADGTFWEDADNQKLAKDDAAAHRQLIQAVVEADAEINGAAKPVRRRLLVLMVLITYLEDRGVFPPGHFGRYRAGVRSFRELLRVGAVDEVTRLLRHFEKKFNGDVFSLPNDGESLTATELELFAKLVEGKTLGKQKHFWELFNFEYIPVEVISRLYQRFVTGHGAVYTPPLLVSLLLDQVMPYDRITGKEQVLDPSCGSGIFLVGAFKRLVNHWRSRHRWQQPTVEVLKSILSHSIHGVEMEAAAVDLSAFSLALAMCDLLDPPVIWSSLTFDKLRGRNLREGDFFDLATFTNGADHDWPGKFDIIVGNPPFQSELTDEAKSNSAKTRETAPRLPDQQVAYLFLGRALTLLEANGALCLLQPHGILYNAKTMPYRRHLMDLARLDSVLDFVSIRRMFEGKDKRGADAKVIAWHAINDGKTSEYISHFSFRRTYATRQRIVFELDHYDLHVVKQSEARLSDEIWRANLLGGGRLSDVALRLANMPKFETMISSRNWVYCEGFNTGSGGKPCDYLTGQPFLPTSALTDVGIQESKITTLKEESFELPRVKDLYEPPLILIKEHASLPIGFWTRSRLTFKHSIVGLHATKADVSRLRSVFRHLVEYRRLYQFCFLLIGSRALTGRSTAVNKCDIDNLPFPEEPSELDLAFWEEMLKEDVLNYMADFVRLGQDSVLLKKSANEGDVGEYSSLYVRMLGSVYRNLKAAEPVFFNGLIAQPFYFGKKPEVDWLQQGDQDAMKRLIYDHSRDALRVVRVVRYYESNVILIVKPDRLRYWIKSTAIRDADDTLVDLRQQGW